MQAHVRFLNRQGDLERAPPFARALMMHELHRNGSFTAAQVEASDKHRASAIANIAAEKLRTAELEAELEQRRARLGLPRPAVPSTRPATASSSGGAVVAVSTPLAAREPARASPAAAPSLAVASKAAPRAREPVGHWEQLSMTPPSTPKDSRVAPFRKGAKAPTNNPKPWSWHMQPQELEE